MSSGFIELPVYFPNEDKVRSYLIARDAITAAGPYVYNETQTILSLTSNVEIRLCVDYPQLCKLLGYKKPALKKGKANA